MSLAALRYAASGSFDDPAALAQWLYRFGTVPRGPAFDRDFGPDDDPMAVLGLTIGGSTRRLLESACDASSLAGWYSFARTGVEVQTSAACKLYVSPRPEALAVAFPRVIDVLVRTEVRSFKVGRGIEGLLRPDKIVAYFDDRADLLRVAAALSRALNGCPAQGTPFTHEIGADGMLSSGVDPAGQLTSWRAWVTRQLATSLIAHRDMSCHARVEAVLADMRIAGLDPDNWQPYASVSCEEVAS